MLRKLLHVVPCLFFITGCQSLLPPSNSPDDQTSKIELLDPATLEFTELNLHTDFHGEHGCLLSEVEPQNTNPYWIPPSTLWQRIPLGFKLQQVDQPRLTAEFNWYAKNPAYMKRVSQRAERYGFHIIEEIEKIGMPTEFALLPIVESAFDPFAYSHGRASGMWQFIPGTARMFKLKSNWWYDGRRDTIASTNAALTYLQNLSRYYKDDWLLALAAYNSGQGTVNKAIRKNKRKGKPTHFWALDLPRETRSYVPKLLALAKIFDNPQRYGITLHPVANEPYFTAVDTKSQIDLAQAAELADVDIEEIYKLNPGFNRWATDPNGPHQLLVPAHKAELFKQRVSQLNKKDRLHWQRYTVTRGDSLLVLAKRFNTGTDTIRKVNKIKGNTIRIGQKLMIPTASKASHLYAYSASERSGNIQKNRKGEKGTRQIYHTVVPGESLWSIAKKHQVSSKKIAHWNGFAPKDLIRPGQKLSVWVKPITMTKSITTAAAQQSMANSLHRNAVVKKLGYTVRNGDSLARIADKFKIKLNDIVKWNGVNPKKYLQPGQRLTLYVDVINRH
ncbi:MAG: membrane-bound lytic murein transglycosylase D [Pseudohongiellaceae bacterium]|jgi:membrane-bound lytic murein transglycosylase D